MHVTRISKYVRYTASLSWMFKLKLFYKVSTVTLLKVFLHSSRIWTVSPSCLKFRLMVQRTFTKKETSFFLFLFFFFFFFSLRFYIDFIKRFYATVTKLEFPIFDIYIYLFSKFISAIFLYCSNLIKGYSQCIVIIY